MKNSENIVDKLMTCILWCLAFIIEIGGAVYVFEPSAKTSSIIFFILVRLAGIEFC